MEISDTEYEAPQIVKVEGVEALLSIVASGEETCPF